jgi:hypothetical protein
MQETRHTAERRRFVHHGASGIVEFSIAGGDRFPAVIHHTAGCPAKWCDCDAEFLQGAEVLAAMGVDGEPGVWTELQRIDNNNVAGMVADMKARIVAEWTAGTDLEDAIVSAASGMYRQARQRGCTDEEATGWGLVVVEVGRQMVKAAQP